MCLLLSDEQMYMQMSEPEPYMVSMQNPIEDEDIEIDGELSKEIIKQVQEDGQDD